MFWFSKSFFFRLTFCTHVGTGIVHPHLIQNRALNLRKCQVYTFHSVSPSPVPIAALFWSYSECRALSLAVWVRVSFAIGFPLVPVDGEDQPLSSVPGIQAPNHTFPLWDLVLLFCLLLLGRALPFLPFPLWPNSLSEATSSCPGTDYLTCCLCWGHGVSCLTIAGIDVAAALLAGFGGVFGKGEHVTLAFGATGSKFSLWCHCSSFLSGITFSNIGIHFRKWWPILIGQCWDYWSHLIFHF